MPECNPAHPRYTYSRARCFFTNDDARIVDADLRHALYESLAAPTAPHLPKVPHSNCCKHIPSQSGVIRLKCCRTPVGRRLQNKALFTSLRPRAKCCAALCYQQCLLCVWKDGTGRPSLAGHAHNSRVNPAAGGPRLSLTPDHRDATQPHFRRCPAPGPKAAWELNPHTSLVCYSVEPHTPD